MADSDVVERIQKAFISFTHRAERNSDDVLIETFVDSAPLFDKISTNNNQIIFGRRGTGKTHVMKYLMGRVRNANDFPIFIDLRSIGSNTSIYSDSARALSERATYLINDVLKAVLSDLYQIAIQVLDAAPDPNQISLRLDDFSAAISNLKIVGEIAQETQSSNESTVTGAVAAKAGLANATLGGNVGFNRGRTDQDASSTRRTESGREILHLDFSNIQNALAGLIDVLGLQRIWLLIDEWSEVPIELQPYLADLFRRTILPVSRIVLKIAAIEHRSEFLIRKSTWEYIGFELAADISAALNLDDFLVFDADEARSVSFFKNLIFRHYKAGEFASDVISSPDDLIRAAFTQQNVFAEFVKAVEGVPRDALNLAGTIAQKAYSKQITMIHVRQSARDWFQLDKASAVRANSDLQSLLNRVVDEVIGHRKARAFLFPSNERHPLIEALFDARILHLWKKNISSKDQPGRRFDVFKIDYGAYVDLINTANETKGLFVADVEEIGAVEEAFVDVPRDDYRSIRRAVLEPEYLVGLAGG